MRRPERKFKAQYKLRWPLRPLTATSACSPTRAQAARKGGHSRKAVSSNSKTRARPARPAKRFRIARFF
jgi:hypothetical protein